MYNKILRRLQRRGGSSIVFFSLELCLKIMMITTIGYSTNDLFKILKIFSLDQLYDKISILETHKNKSNFKHLNRKNTRSTTEDDLIPNKPNTTLMENVYVYKRIKSFNK